MKYKLFLGGALIALAIAVPLTLTLSKSASLLKVEKTTNSQLQLQIKSDEKIKADQELRLKQQETEKQQLQQKNDDLQKQLQAKAEAKAKIAQQSAPTAVTAPVIAKTTSCADYRNIVAQYDWNVDIALAVMRAESGCNTMASSPTCDHGLMQINCVHADLVAGNLAALNDPATNIRVAYAVYRGAGWKAWTTYNTGAYLKFL